MRGLAEDGSRATRDETGGRSLRGEDSRTESRGGLRAEEAAAARGREDHRLRGDEPQQRVQHDPQQQQRRAVVDEALRTGRLDQG